MVEPYLIVSVLLLLASLAARALPLLPRFDADLSARHVAYLRRGRYGVVLTVLAELHAQGCVDASRPGAVTVLHPPNDLDDELAHAVHDGLGARLGGRVVPHTPDVRRACAALRADLVEQGLLAPLRRRVFGYTVLFYAAGLALATAYERGPQHSTMASAAIVTAAALVSAVGPRRTVAGCLALRAERHLLDHLVASSAGATDESLLAAMVAADGRPALELLCARYLPVGAFTPAAPIEPMRPVAPVIPAPIVPAPVFASLISHARPVRELVAVGARAGVPRPDPPARQANTTRRAVAEPVGYERPTTGPAIVVRPAFVPAARRA